VEIRTTGVGCQTCKRHADLVPLIREYAEARAGVHPCEDTVRRAARVDVRAFHRSLEPLGYELSALSLDRHLKKCERDVWDKVK
jgi:hypothetical protein